MFIRLQIKTFLIGTMLTLAAITLVQSISWCYTTYTFDKQLDTLNNGTLPSVIMLETIRNHVADAQMLVSRHIMSTSAVEMQNCEHLMRGKMARVDSELAAYPNLVSSPEEGRLYLQLVAAWRTWKNTWEPIRRASHNPEWNKVTALFNGEQAKSANRLDAAVDAIVDYNGRAAMRTAEEGERLSSRALTIAAVSGLIGVLLAGTVFILVRRRIVRPLDGLIRAASAMAAGEPDLTIPGADAADEFGELARAIDGIKAHVAQRAREDAAAIHAARSEAEAQRREERQREAERAQTAQREQRTALLTELAVNFDGRIAELLESVTQAGSALTMTASDMLETADQTTRRATTVASASTQAATNVQAMAAAAEELSLSIGNIAGRVSRSAEISRGAVARSEATGQRVQALAAAASKIENIVGLINSIADQTNLLALNATIEAARAGDAGRGFAVVASEVKALAAQTARATDEISTQIIDMQQATEVTISAIVDIQKVIGELGEITSDIAVSVEQQGHTTAEISHNVLQTAIGTQEVTLTIHEVSKATISTGAAAAEVLQSSTDLSRQADSLKHEVDRFLRDIRAA